MTDIYVIPHTTLLHTALSSSQSPPHRPATHCPNPTDLIIAQSPRHSIAQPSRPLSHVTVIDCGTKPRLQARRPSRCLSKAAGTVHPLSAGSPPKGPVPVAVRTHNCRNPVTGSSGLLSSVGPTNQSAASAYAAPPTLTEPSKNVLPPQRGQHKSRGNFRRESSPARVAQRMTAVVSGSRSGDVGSKNDERSGIRTHAGKSHENAGYAVKQRRSGEIPLEPHALTTRPSSLFLRHPGLIRGYLPSTSGEWRSGVGASRDIWVSVVWGMNLHIVCRLVRATWSRITRNLW